MKERNPPEKNEQSLRNHFLSELGIIPWKEIEVFYANGSAVYVDPAIDIVEVAVQMALDNTEQFENWIQGGLVFPLPDHKAEEFASENKHIHALVVSPWVLVTNR